MKRLAKNMGRFYWSKTSLHNEGTEKREERGQESRNLGEEHFPIFFVIMQESMYPSWRAAGGPSVVDPTYTRRCTIVRNRDSHLDTHTEQL